MDMIQQSGGINIPCEQRTGWGNIQKGVIIGGLAAAGFGLCGTGGNLTPSNVDQRTTTGGQLLSLKGVQATPRRRHVLAKDQVLSIQHSLGLSVTQISESLRVSRPIIYSWMKGFSLPRQENAKRLQEVYQITLQWKGMSTHAPKKYLNTVISGEQSLVELLSADKLDAQAINNTLITLNGMIEQEQAIPNEGSVASLLKRRGFDTAPDKIQKYNIDRLSRTVKS